MQRSGVDVDRDGETLFLDKIKDLLHTEKIIKNGCPNKIDINKAARKISERQIETVNLYGVWYEGPAAVVKKRIENENIGHRIRMHQTQKNGSEIK